MAFRIKILPGKEKSLLGFHPWVYSRAFEAPKESIPDGSIVELYSSQNSFLGFGFWEAQGKIRIIDFEKTQVFDKNFWMHRMNASFQLRKENIDLTVTNAYRVINSEGDGLPGLIADIYSNSVCLQIGTQGMRNLLPMITEFFVNEGFRTILEKREDGSLFYLEGSSGFETIRENNISFHVYFQGGQKTGFFLDQRENRALVRAQSKGKKVLNLFGYTGGFSCYALSGEASQVLTVDISKRALEIAAENVALNFPLEKQKCHQTEECDVFSFWDKPRENFDIVILDPPAFAKHSSQVEKATRGYKEINLKAMLNMKPGNRLWTFSCSQNIDMSLFRKIIFGSAKDAKKDFQILRQVHQPLDHPFSVFHPEGEYLKGLELVCRG